VCTRFSGFVDGASVSHRAHREVSVIAGPDPAIHPLSQNTLMMDTRVRPAFVAPGAVFLGASGNLSRAASSNLT
jgi:hypothetical protein